MRQSTYHTLQQYSDIMWSFSCANSVTEVKTFNKTLRGAALQNVPVNNCSNRSLRSKRLAENVSLNKYI